MPDDSIWPAPAKLNLFLHVTGRQADGYHRLQTVFQILDWGDEVAIEPTGHGEIQRLADIPGVATHEDLSIRAAELLKRECGIRAGARIAVNKRIPPGTGLGGASSDAATVLHALNHLWACGLDSAQLAELGLQLGADVPVFVHGRSAWAEGVGERLTPLELGERHYVLVIPEFHISTASVFSDPGLRRGTVPLAFADIQACRDFSGLRNDCEPVVLSRVPELASLVLELAAVGEPRMTGTGSAFFMPMVDKNQALQVTQKMKSRYNVRAVAGVDRSPLLDRLECEPHDG